MYKTLLVSGLITVQAMGMQIPSCGLGTYKLDEACIAPAIQRGFTLIDTAKVYGNEEEVGRAIAGKKGILVITKLAYEYLESAEGMRAAVADSTQKLGRVPDYMLIHGPYPALPLCTRARELEQMKTQGLVRHWGVSNFEVEHLEILRRNDLKPALNQVEYHPYFQRPELLAYCKKHNIILQAYRPLARGAVCTDIDTLLLADGGVSAAMMTYAWLRKLGIPFVTKVSSEEHQIECLKSLRVGIKAEDMPDIAALNKGEAGRTCTRGGWFVPFTDDIVRTWEER